MANKFPAVITARRSKAHLVREAAINLGLAFEEEAPAPGQNSVVRFHFGMLSEVDTKKLVSAVPTDAYNFTSVITK